jgi:hypothetical protein
MRCGSLRSMRCSLAPAQGIRQVNVTGLVATAFTHRDSRAGDPDLHTHVAVANKVQTLDGRWLSIDGRVLFKAKVAASETYNTALGGAPPRHPRRPVRRTPRQRTVRAADPGDRRRRPISPDPPTRQAARGLTNDEQRTPHVVATTTTTGARTKHPVIVRTGQPHPAANPRRAACVGGCGSSKLIQPQLPSVTLGRCNPGCQGQAGCERAFFGMRPIGVLSLQGGSNLE